MARIWTIIGKNTVSVNKVKRGCWVSGGSNGSNGGGEKHIAPEATRSYIKWFIERDLSDLVRNPAWSFGSILLVTVYPFLQFSYNNPKLKSTYYMASDSGNPGILKNIFTGYLILILHVVLLVLLGFFIIFFRGLVQYMPWILGGGLVLCASLLVWVYIGYRRQRSRIQHMRPQARGVEISLLGGLASMRVGGRLPTEEWGANEPLQLEDSHVSRMRSLEHLMDMYNQELISRAEFLRLKGDLLGSEYGQDTGLDEGNGAEECEEATIVEDGK